MFSTTGTAFQPSAIGMLGATRTPSNPWVSDHVLLNLSLWWVQHTRVPGADLPGEVGIVFRSLQQELQ